MNDWRDCSESTNVASLDSVAEDMMSTNSKALWGTSEVWILDCLVDQRSWWEKNLVRWELEVCI